MPRVSETDICDHWKALFVECLGIEAKLIIELGGGDGESTFVFERAARLWGATLVSMDIEDCRKVSSYGKGIFVQQDDMAFGALFKSWCRDKGLESRIENLFPYTRHLYDHTVSEVRSWFPFLADRAKVFFRDTNMHEAFIRKDGSKGKDWDNERDVSGPWRHIGGRSSIKMKILSGCGTAGASSPPVTATGLMVMDRYGR